MAPKQLFIYPKGQFDAGFYFPLLLSANEMATKVHPELFLSF